MDYPAVQECRLRLIVAMDNIKRLKRKGQRVNMIEKHTEIPAHKIYLIEQGEYVPSNEQIENLLDYVKELI